MRDIPVGNGSLLVTFDDKYQIRDIYFPHVGQENHAIGFPFRFGVWADGEFSWVFSDDWSRSLRYLPETLVTDVGLVNEKLSVKIDSNDTVASHENIFLRKVRVTNLGANREFRIFLHHDFRIYENKVGDTAFYDPDTRAIIHYKKHRYFLINTNPGFDGFATGRKAFRGQEGTWRDAEDGELSRGAITEGSVDSTISVHAQLAANSSFEFYYWIAAGTSYEQVSSLQDHVLERRAEKFFEHTENYWRTWVNKNDTDLSGLPDGVVALYKRSLLIIHTQIDDGGAIIAANDSDVAERATDHYSYLWTRDGALIANALDRAGFEHLTRGFFDLCGEIVDPAGYFLQKYNPDGSLASGWHSRWDSNSAREMVPIQEDETGLVLWALWEHYEMFRDIEFAYRLYQSMVVPCADFMVEFRDEATGLPLPSWNLWEDRLGVHTFTCAAVSAGLKAAARFAKLFAEHERQAKYETASREVMEAIGSELYDPTLDRFIRSLQVNGESLQRDKTVDASMFALFYFECFKPDDPRVAGTMKAIEENLRTGRGIARFENDGYMRTSDTYPGNPWFICTLWLAEYYIAKAGSIDELQPALDLLEWVAEAALPSGVLAEQMNAATGEPVSVSPLTWSHSTFVAAVLSYLRKYRSLS
jgi:glucoamylase